MGRNKKNVDVVTNEKKIVTNENIEVKNTQPTKKSSTIEAKNKINSEAKSKINSEAKSKINSEVKNKINSEVKNKTIKATPIITISEKKKVLFVASEATPFIATGGLAEVIGSLPKALVSSTDYDVRVILPLYSAIKEDKRKLMTFLGKLYIPLGWRNQYCGIFTTKLNNVTFYFLDNEYYFKRNGVYGHYDDGERFAYFCRSVLEVMPIIDFYPNILHCHDWQTALAVIYLKTIYNKKEEYKNIKSIFTIHNIEYQGKYSLDILEDIFGISKQYLHLLEFDGCINLLKAAIECSDKISTVSPKYSMELQDDFFAHGLSCIIKKNQFKFCGILNGIDIDSYNSETDSTLFANFSENNLDGKKVCKEELQKMLNLPIRDDVPLIAMVTRLVSHKGLDLVKTVMEDILKENIQFVILGTGDSIYENYFTDLSNKYNGKLVTIIAFNNDLSRKIYSGADLFLMPSKMEPCGLSQMIASRYATVTIVRETGGLFDSIKPVGIGGNGFTFKEYNAHDMLYVIKDAISIFANREQFKEIMKRAISVDFSWKKSAESYKNLYNEILNI